MKQALVISIMFLSFYHLAPKSINQIGSSKTGLMASSIVLKVGEPIKAYLEYLSGDTYFMKFSNSSETDYKVWYRVIYNEKILYESSTIVKAKSENSSGSIHCSEDAKIEITKKEIFK